MGIAMELRSHPLISYRGLSSWPPHWIWIGGKKSQPHPKGEVGVLKRVTASQHGKLNACFLWIAYEQSIYIGCLLISDYPFFQQLVKLLERLCGRSIEKIGGFDLSHLG